MSSLRTDGVKSHLLGRPRLMVNSLACALLLAACGQTADSSNESAHDAELAATDAAIMADANVARFDESLEDDPCAVVTKQQVADAFGVPLTEIEQSSISTCEYEWEGGAEDNLNVEIYIHDVFDSVTAATTHFNNATRSMSGAEVASAMGKIKGELEDSGKVDAEGQRKSAEGVTSIFGADGFTFVDVPGVGDQARFDTGTGELNVRVDNLYFSISAYRGPGMEMPDELNIASIQRAHKAWMKETGAEHKQAAVKLTKAAVAAL